VRTRELAEWLGATFEGDGEKELSGVAPIETAGAADLSFVGTLKGQRQADASAAGCLIVPGDYDNSAGRTVIRATEPRTAFARAVAMLCPVPAPPPGIHPTAVVAPDVELGEGVSVAPRASIGEGTRVGPGTGHSVSHEPRQVEK